MLITQVTLKIIVQNKYSLFGHLTVHTKNHGRFMFNSCENYEKRIKEGEYTLYREFSPRFGGFRLTVGGVSGRRGLRIHAGNSGIDFRGCIGVGVFGISEDIPQYIYNSKLAVASLERLTIITLELKQGLLDMLNICEETRMCFQNELTIDISK
jgi:hypothetical protein